MSSMVNPVEREGLPENGFALMFNPGERPDVDRIAQILREDELTSLAAQIGHRPSASQGWVEIIANGLTFDLCQLSPARPSHCHEALQEIGFSDGGADRTEGEYVSLVPSGHIAAGAGLPPVVRSMAALAANFAMQLPVRAIGWMPARTLIEPGYFSRAVLGWLAGGAFPALGLTALERGADGAASSRGLSFFTGREMQLEARADEAPADMLKLAVRVIDCLVSQGPLVEPREVTLGHQKLVVEPASHGNRVWVWRSG